ncbi:MAG: hypothetical protein J6B75_09660 [Ruminococcus sp.]|nr:hypothetical protein [Ruminococcus sp.]
MKKCPSCGKDLDDMAAICVGCGHAFSDIKPNDRKANAGEIIIAILFPIIGAILYYVYKKDKPTAAKTLNLVSVIAFLAYILLPILGGIILGVISA